MRPRLKFTAARARMSDPTQEQLTGHGQSDRPFTRAGAHSIHGERCSFLVSTQTPEHSGISFDDQQRRVGLPMITSMKTEFFFGFLIGFVTGVLLCVGIMFLIEPSHFP